MMEVTTIFDSDRAEYEYMQEQIEVITYEQERLNYFTDLMNKAQKRYKQLFKKFKDAPIMSAESEMLSDAGRETQFHGDVVEMLEKGYRKQSEWISVEDRLPDREGKYLVCTTNGNIGVGNFFDYYGKGTHLCFDCWAVTHWMPLPEAPKMKGGAE